MIEDNVVAAFHLMWGKFPEAVMLIHKSREILAVNEEAKKLGRTPGMKCSQIGPPEGHRICQANKALAEQQAKYVKYIKADGSGKELIGVWLPLADGSDRYVHFSIGNVINVKIKEEEPAAW